MEKSQLRDYTLAHFCILTFWLILIECFKNMIPKFIIIFFFYLNIKFSKNKNQEKDCISYHNKGKQLHKRIWCIYIYILRKELLGDPNFT